MTLVKVQVTIERRGKDWRCIDQPSGVPLGVPEESREEAELQAIERGWRIVNPRPVASPA